LARDIYTVFGDELLSTAFFCDQTSQNVFACVLLQISLDNNPEQSPEYTPRLVGAANTLGVYPLM
jgi:hypothetical protein